MKKILITGASGFIGSFLVERFLEDNEFEVYAGMRDTSSKKYLTDNRIKFFQFDLSNVAGSQKDLRRIQFDYVLHNAGVTQTPGANDYEKFNAKTTLDFYSLLAGLENPPKKFVYMSSLGAYGPADYQKSGIVKDDSLPHPVTAYGRSKLLAEKMISKDGRIPYCFIRPSAVYGPRETNMFKVFKLINKGLEVHIRYQDQKLTFIYVKDLVELIYRATIQGKHNSAYFGASEEYYTSVQLASLVKKILVKKTWKINLPLSLVKVVARVSEVWSSLTDQYSILNRDKINEIKSLSWVVDLGPVKRDLHFTNKYSLEEGLEETLAWYRENGWLK